MSSSAASCAWKRHEECGGLFGQFVLWLGCERALNLTPLQGTIGPRIESTSSTFSYHKPGGLVACAPINGWSNIIVPGISFCFILNNIIIRIENADYLIWTIIGKFFNSS